MDVTFETQKDKFCIEVGYFDTVLEIKEKVQKYRGIPVPRQTLIFNGQILEDERDIEFCEILHDSRIQLIVAPDPDKTKIKPSSPKKIQLNIRISTSKNLVPIEMEAGDSVGKLKEKIQEMESAPVVRLMIHSSGVQLQENSSLSEYELGDNCEIDVIFRPSPTVSATSSGNASRSKKLKLHVLPKCGTKKIPVEVNLNDTVGQLRKELQKVHQQLQFPLPQEGYFFIYKQNVMDDDRTFRWHNVCQGDTIEIFNGSVTGGS